MVSHPGSLGFYSQVFLVPKKNSKLRPLSTFVSSTESSTAPHFKIQTVGDITATIQTGDWATCLNLTDAYFHIPVASWFRKYLRFVVGGTAYQF